VVVLDAEEHPAATIRRASMTRVRRLGAAIRVIGVGSSFVVA